MQFAKQFARLGARARFIPNCEQVTIVGHRGVRPVISRGGSDRLCNSTPPIRGLPPLLAPSPLSRAGVEIYGPLRTTTPIPLTTLVLTPA